MRSIVLGFLTLIGAAAMLSSAQRTPATLFEGARLIAGDGRAPIENAAFLVDNGWFTQVGTKGSVQAPPGTRRVDLTGKTVMPALVDAHVHLGYRRGTSFTADNYTSPNLRDELDRFSYYGVGAVLEAGTGRGVLPFSIRAEAHSGARLLTAGRGFAMPNAGPGVPMRDAPYGVTSEAEARRDVQELAAIRPDMIKIWVDDRGGTVEKLKPELYRAIIDEAHKHGIRVMAHISALDDAKDLLRAGVDGFGHVVRDRDIDQELIALLHERPRVFFTETLWGERNAIYGRKPAWLDEPLLGDTLSSAEIQSLADGFSTPTAIATDSAQRLLRNVAILNRAGVTLALGTDTGGVTGGGYFGLASLVELELLVKAGLTPSEAIVAGTRTSAAVLGLDGLGTIASRQSASFIVLDANPLDEIANARKIASVYIGGREIDRGALRSTWSRRRSEIVTHATISTVTLNALESAYGRAFETAELSAGRFSPDGSQLALRVTNVGRDSGAIWLCTLKSQSCTPVSDEPPEFVRELERQGQGSSFKRENARYSVWLEHHLHGAISLLVAQKNRKGVRLLVDARWELESFVFDAERSTVLYPVEHTYLHNGPDGKSFFFEKLGGEIVVADLRTLGKRSVALPNGSNLRLLDQTRDAHRIAYVVNGTCLARDSKTDVRQTVCLADR